LAKKRILRIVGGWSVVIFGVLGVSYCSELPKHRFQDRAAESTSAVPGARAIGSKMRRTILSPISWFWPATTETTFALPDPRVADRFYTMTLAYGERGVARLVGIECGVVSGVINLESSGVEAPDWRPRHDEHYHEA
jgi:hypothetical protein